MRVLVRPAGGCMIGIVGLLASLTPAHAEPSQVEDIEDRFPQTSEPEPFPEVEPTQPVSLSFAADNRGTHAYGQDQAVGTMILNSLISDGDAIESSLFAIPSDTRELLFGQIIYTSPWWDGAFSTTLLASFTQAMEGDVPEDEAITDQADRIRAGVLVPLIDQEDENLVIGLALDGRDYREQIPGSPDLAEATRILRGALTYDFADESSRNDVVLELSHGLDGLGASQNGDINLTRIDGRPQFTKLELRASRLETFSELWSLMLLLRAQVSDGAMVSNEEFGVGGEHIGRPYEAREITGDNGVGASAELRYTMQNAFDAFEAFVLYVYADGGAISNEDSDPGAEDAGLASAGAGLRITPIENITANVELAQPIGRDVEDEGNRNMRVRLAVSANW